jgi:methylmalonyl-CoA mutase
LIPALIEALAGYGRQDIKVIAGGVIPPQDYDYLYQRGVVGIYGPGTPMLSSVRDVLSKISENHD